MWGIKFHLKHELSSDTKISIFVGKVEDFFLIWSHTFTLMSSFWLFSPILKFTFLRNPLYNVTIIGQIVIGEGGEGCERDIGREDYTKINVCYL